MPDRIYVTYTKVISAYSPFYHATLNYERTDAKGNVIHHETLSAAPEHKDLSTGDKVDATLEELSRSDKGASRFGVIKAAHETNTNRPDDPYETVGMGTDLSAKWDAMVQFTKDFNENGHAYRGSTQNSNTFAAAALNAGGLRARGFVRYPGDGLVTPIPVPGLDAPLEGPIGQGLKWAPQPKPPTPIEFPLTDGPLPMSYPVEQRAEAPERRAESKPALDTFGPSAKPFVASRASGSLDEPPRATAFWQPHPAADLRRTELEAEMRKPRGENRYWQEPALQDEYRDLLGQMERPAARIAPRPGDPARKAEIEAAIREGRFGDYWRPGSGLPDEYRAILKREASLRSDEELA